MTAAPLRLGVDTPRRCNGHTLDELREQLAAPFPPEWIDWKPLTAGWKGDPSKAGAKPWVKVMAYVDARAIMDRLDDVCGVGNWKDEYSYSASGGVLCGLSIKIGDEWVTKWDGAEETDISKVKGGISNALKRCAVKWGIGRYLYDIGLSFGVIAPDDDWDAKQVTPKDSQKRDMKPFRWKPPRLPAWALPGGSGKPGVLSEEQRKRGDAAAAALAAPPAAEVVMPGTRAHFGGNGGKRLKDIPTKDLSSALEQLRAIGSERYTQVIEAIGEVLADRASAGA